MQLGPILSTLRHHKLTAALLALQVAFTCAIVCNAVFLIVQRIERITVPSGLDESPLSVVELDDLQADTDALPLHQADVAALRQLPGVASAAIVSNVPFSNSQHSSGGCTSLDAIEAVKKARSIEVPGCASADEYAGGPGVLQTLGLKLVAGRDFRADEYLPDKPDAPVDLPAIIVSKAFAGRLYPEHPDHVVGRILYFGGSGILHGHGTPIVGVVAHLHRANFGSHGSNDQSVLMPVEPIKKSVMFALRSKPSDRARVMKEALAVLAKRKPDRQLSADNAQTYAQIRSDYFRRDATMVNLLLAAVLGLLFVTALGIAGLASFWVGQRTRTIGIRRAIGATRGDILRYFLTENFLIVGVGIVLGLVLAIALNLMLMQHYEMPRLPWFYLPVSAIILWSLGQLAVLNPALHAAAVPPATATRSV
ncbi:MAG TPA: FtsX-like permease family protein [Gammaproteobacteria bacterium]|nr:FtsX-like permease family protein [Gammaproteobacteria bacterium]